MTEFSKRIAEAELGCVHLFSVGQAGFIIKSQTGQLLCIDLYLSDCVEQVEGNMGYKRLLPKILHPTDLIFDVIVSTHFHRDHFDEYSVPFMMSNNKSRLFASFDCMNDVKSLEIDKARVVFVKPGDSFSIGDFALDFLYCDHGKAAPKAVGVSVRVGNKRIVEVGDTRLRLDRREHYLAHGPIDVLIAPINGMFGNMNARECAELAGCLKPRMTIPCHYGMFASHMGLPGEFYEIMKKEYPSNAFLLMSLGEHLVL